MNLYSEFEKGLYFVHGCYFSDNYNIDKINLKSEIDLKEIKRNRMIIMKDNIEDIYAIQAYDVDTNKFKTQNEFISGDFIYYNGESFEIANHNITASMYSEISKRLSQQISYINYGNESELISNNEDRAYSYHINVGHGNCSIVVFRVQSYWTMWMIDSSVFDFTEKKDYSSNLRKCLNDIKNKFRVDRISKLFITHLHYDHINGIEYLIKNNYINSDTEVWMNLKYPWNQPTYIRILSLLNNRKVKFIDPIIANSNEKINILYPDYSFKNKQNINNTSVLYQIKLLNKSMLFTGDIETEGWNRVKRCIPFLAKSDYYCVSHHGSITGHLRNGCGHNNNISSVADCSVHTNLQILMGRNGAYKGIYSPIVQSDFKNLFLTENSNYYIKIDWSNNHVEII